jgi:hypothetical protein
VFRIRDFPYFISPDLYFVLTCNQEYLNTFFSSVLRIRIGFNADPDPAFQFQMRIRVIQVSMTKTENKNYSGKKYVFDKKKCNLLIPRPP